MRSCSIKLETSGKLRISLFIRSSCGVMGRDVWPTLFVLVNLVIYEVPLEHFLLPWYPSINQEARSQDGGEEFRTQNRRRGGGRLSQQQKTAPRIRGEEPPALLGGANRLVPLPWFLPQAAGIR